MWSLNFINLQLLELLSKERYSESFVLGAWLYRTHIYYIYQNDRDEKLNQKKFTRQERNFRCNIIE